MFVFVSAVMCCRWNIIAVVHRSKKNNEMMKHYLAEALKKSRWNIFFIICFFILFAHLEPLVLREGRWRKKGPNMD